MEREHSESDLRVQPAYKDIKMLHVMSDGEEHTLRSQVAANLTVRGTSGIAI